MDMDMDMVESIHDPWVDAFSRLQCAVCGAVGEDGTEPVHTRTILEDPEG